MSQKQYTERPYKVLGEQYDPAASPLQAGVCVCTVLMGFEDGRPHVHPTPTMAAALQPTDWIVQDGWDLRWLVMPDAEFTARFGGGGTVVAEG